MWGSGGHEEEKTVSLGGLHALLAKKSSRSAAKLRPAVHASKPEGRIARCVDGNDSWHLSPQVGVDMIEQESFAVYKVSNRFAVWQKDILTCYYYCCWHDTYFATYYVFGNYDTSYCT
jgi:hypothetical protein